MLLHVRKAVHPPLQQALRSLSRVWPVTESVLAASIQKLVFQYGRSLTDAEAKPWRAAMLRALSTESVMGLQLPLLVELFQPSIRKYAFHMFVCWMWPPTCVSQLLTATTLSLIHI